MSGGPALAVIAAAPPATVRWRRAAAAVGGIAALAECSRSDLAALGLEPDAWERLRRPQPARLARWERWLAAAGHALITLDSTDYPPRLAELADAPLALWTDGAAPTLLSTPQIAVVGSRHATAGGASTARQLAAGLSRAGITATSGLAAGIDSAAHDGAVELPGSTIAVLGTGIDLIYPRRNRPLADRIRARGLLVSEYPPGVGPRPHHFPTRNRVIAGLSLGTLVVEAAQRSGALITARLAGSYGREVFAVPGSIHSTLSKGCHNLLRNGACLVESVQDILLEIAPALAEVLAPADSRAAAADADSPAGPEGKLLSRLDFAPVTIAELEQDTGLTAGELSSMLLHLELEGKVEALPGGRFCRLS